MPHKTKQSALTAARKALGDTAAEGVDFNLRQTGAGWVHEPIPPANEPAKKARAAKAPKKAAAPAPKAPSAKAKAPKKARAARAAPKPAAPEGTSKTEMLVAMLSTAGGATSKEMETATGWQSHSVRGLLGTLKKRGVNVVSKKLKGEPTIYRIVKAAPAAAAAETVGDVI